MLPESIAIPNQAVPSVQGHAGSWSVLRDQGRADSFQSRFGKAFIVSKAELVDQQLWKDSFSHLCLDHRYYQILERTIQQTFDYRYLVIEDTHGEVRVVQPLFIVHQDITAGLPRPVQSLMGAVRRVFPNFLKLKTLMAGCTVGEGHLGTQCEEHQAWLGEALHEVLGLYARQCNASIIVLKDFPSHYRQNLAPFSNNGYARVPSFPGVRLDIEFADFNDYMQTKLSKVTRKGLRRKFKRVASLPPIEMEVRTDVDDIIEEIYPLYQSVYDRAEFRFEKLTKDYFREIGAKMRDKARFFVWRQSGKIVAFDLCLLHDGVLHDCCIGLDYSVALDLHLYFITWRDVITWAIENKIKRYYSGPLNYDSKLHFRCELAPLDLYVCHTSGVINPLFRRAMKFLQPTRHEPLLKRFKNAAEI